MFSIDAWEDRIFAFGRFLRTLMFFYLIVKLILGVFYRIDPSMVAGWFAYEAKYISEFVLVALPEIAPTSAIAGNLFSAIMVVFQNLPLISFIVAPFAAFFSMEHSIWLIFFGPTASLQKDLILIGAIVIFVYVLLKSKTKRGD